MGTGQKAIKSGIAYTIISLINSVIPVLTTPIITRLLSVEEYGAFVNFTSWVGVISIIVTLQLSGSLISAKVDFKEDFKRYTFSIIVFSILTVVFFLCVFNLCQGLLAEIFCMNRLTMNVMLVYICFNEIICIYNANMQFRFEYMKVARVSIINVMTTALMSVLLVVVCCDRLVGRLIGYVLPTLIIGGVIFVKLWLESRSVNWKYFKYAVTVSLPYVPHILSLTLLFSLDRIMINKICGERETALYSMAYTCATMVTIVMTAMNNAYSPWLAEKIWSDSTDDIRDSSIKYVSIFLYLVLGISLFAPWLLWFLGGSQYSEARSVMPPVLMGCVVQMIYTMYVNIEQIKKKTIQMTIVSAIAAAVNWGMNAIFIPQYGYIAAAYTTLFSYIILALLHMLVVKKVVKCNYYDNKIILALIGVCMVLPLGIDWLYENSNLCVLLFIIYLLVTGVVALRNYARIKEILTKKHEVINGKS